MIAFIAWYLILTLLGWLTFPLVFRLFPVLRDRGYTFARAAGLLLWAYVFWLFTTLGISSNNLGGILFGLLPLVALSMYAIFAIPAKGDLPQRRGSAGRRSIRLAPRSRSRRSRGSALAQPGVRAAERPGRRAR